MASDLERLDEGIRRASSGPDGEYAQVLERGLAACVGDPAAAEYLDELELHSELATVYDRLGQVDEALTHADVLVERGYRCTPDPRCRRAEILTRHGRLAEAAAIWNEVVRGTPDDVWVYNNAGLEYAEIGKYELALPWLTGALELAVRTGDPERLLGQLRGLRARTLTALGLDPDELQSAKPAAPSSPRRPPDPMLGPVEDTAASERAGPQPPVAVAWVPAEEYAHLDERWPDLVDADAVLDDVGGRVPHPEYCRRLERRMHEARDAGVTRIHIAPLIRAVFTRWMDGTDTDDDDPAQLRARHAAALCQQPAQVIAWPPGRNASCWCGSGRKYKKCCGGPGLDGSR